MANYESFSRSNYFRVTDKDSFRAWAEKHDLDVREKPGVEVVCGDRSSDTYFALFGIDGGWPCYYYDDLMDVDHDFDIYQEITRFLHPDDVAVFMEIGWEKLRYLVGVAVAVNAKGDIRKISLNDIYEVASAELGANPTPANH